MAYTINSDKPKPFVGRTNTAKSSARLALDIIDAYDELGGVEFLTNLGTTDPRTFVALLGKILPKVIEIPRDGSEDAIVINLVQPAAAVEKDITPGALQDGSTG